MRPSVPERINASPVRLLRNGRQRRAVGLYFSVRNGRHLPFESTLELHDLWRVEVESAVVASFVQPFTLQLADGGARWRYTPDRRDLMADGSQRVVEVKDDGWAEKDPRYYARLEHAARELGRERVRLCVHTRGEIQAEPRFGAIATVQRHRRTAVSAAEQVLVQERVSRDGQISLGTLQLALGGGVRALAVVCALMVRRVVAIDLAAGLHDEAQVKGVD